MQPITHFGPICSLKVAANKYLFSGEGPSLKIYDYVTGEKLFERIIFNRNKIHGIAILNDDQVDNDESLVKLAVWGGRSLSIFTLKELKDDLFQIPHLGVGDWIFHCLFENDEKLHILNSHNIVETISIEDFTKPKLVESRNCGWKSILYSGTMHKDRNTGKIIVLAGTVMNGILIWDLETKEMKHNLTQHEGSIFNVISSPDSKYILSCSDDRSIKIWSMETGKLLANGWGHGSRIWGLSVFSVSDDGFKVFSCSEDCTARIWNFNNDSEDLQQERIILGHTGRHIWSCAIDDVNKIGFTGGADGKIIVTDLAEDERNGYLGKKWELGDIANQINKKFIKNELVKEYGDFGSGLLVVTSQGRVLILKNYEKWELLFEDSRFERFCILRGFKKQSIVLLGNKLGNIIAMKFDKNSELVLKSEFDITDHFSRLGNLLVQEYNNRLFVLLESPNPKDDLIYKELDPNDFSIKSTTKLVKPDEKINITSIAYDINRNFLIIGCRFATLIVYEMSTHEVVEPLTFYKNIFKGDTISSLKMLNDCEKCTFYLTNKDGTYHILQINENNEYEFLHSSRIQKGFLEGLIRLPNGDIILYGFKSDCFFVWNETRQYEMFREICGGPHRQWLFNYWINENDGRLKYRFIYTRASEVQIVQNGEPYAVEYLSTGLQGREIRDVCVVNTDKNQDEKVIITGAEDTTIKISTLYENGDIKVHWTYREHVAGLISMHKINNNYIISTSAREELFLWKRNECDGKQCLALDGMLSPFDKNPDLRIMNCDTIEVFDDNNKLIGFLLVSVYSNSSIRVIYYDFSTKKFIKLISDKYLTCCIFNVRFLVLNKEIYILIGSTNGYVAIYEINELVEKYFKFNDNKNLKVSGVEILESDEKLGKLILNQQLHQSSIKSLDIIQRDVNKIKLVTGGDDNALIFSEISNTGKSCLEIDIKSFESSAASSTITTVDKVDDDHVLVGSVDQIVKLWEVVDELKLVGENYSTVADIGCSDIVDFPSGNKYAMIGGAGISSWKI